MVEEISWCAAATGFPDVTGIHWVLNPARAKARKSNRTKTLFIG
jgi:hypothetical protein